LKSRRNQWGYQFKVFVKPEENQAMAIEELHQKISSGWKKNEETIHID